MAWNRIERYQSDWRHHPQEIETALAYVIASGAARDQLEAYLKQNCADIEETWRPYLETLQFGTVGDQTSTTRAIEPLSRSGEDSASETEVRLRQTLQDNPNRADIWTTLARVLSKQSERAAEAEAAYRKAIELNPNLASAWIDLGNLLKQQPERVSEAEVVYQKAIDLDPKFAPAWSNLGILIAGQPGRQGEAEAAYRKAIELYGTFAPAWHNLGNVLAQKPEQRVAAETAYRKAIELDAKAARPWASLGRLLAKTPERQGEAEAAYRKAIELDPKLAWPWRDLGRLLAKTPERQGEAEAAYRTVVALKPNYASHWNALGVFLACLAAKPKEAEFAFRKAVELEPHGALHVRNLGVLLYCELGAPQEAVYYLARVHQIRPGDRVSSAILAAALRTQEPDQDVPDFFDAAGKNDFWNELLDLCENYPPFAKLLLAICDLVQERNSSSAFVPLYRAFSYAQLRDFPRASVALDDALTGDPIELLSLGQRHLRGSLQLLSKTVVYANPSTSLRRKAGKTLGVLSTRYFKLLMWDQRTTSSASLSNFVDPR